MRIEWTKKAGTDMGRLPLMSARRICTKVEYDAMREHIEDPEDILAARAAENGGRIPMRPRSAFCPGTGVRSVCGGSTAACRSLIPCSLSFNGHSDSRHDGPSTLQQKLAPGSMTGHNVLMDSPRYG